MSGSTLRLVANDPTAAPRRFRPRAGTLLTLANIRGSWRPSGTTAGGGMFTVLWTAFTGSWWAPLHDFEPADQLRLIDECRRADAEQFGGHL